MRQKEDGEGQVYLADTQTTPGVHVFIHELWLAGEREEDLRVRVVHPAGG